MSKKTFTMSMDRECEIVQLLFILKLEPVPEMFSEHRVRVSLY